MAAIIAMLSVDLLRFGPQYFAEGRRPVGESVAIEKPVSALYGPVIGIDGAMLGLTGLLVIEIDGAIWPTAR